PVNSGYHLSGLDIGNLQRHSLTPINRNFPKNQVHSGFLFRFRSREDNLKILSECCQTLTRLVVMRIATSKQVTLSKICGALLLAFLIAAPNWAAAQKGSSGQGGGGQGGGNQQGSPGNNQGNQGGAPPAGITGGSSPIEATLFSYAALNADARRIAHEIQGHVGGPYIVTTANDISVILQWRTVIAQAEGLQRRLDRAETALDDLPDDQILPHCNINPGAPAQAAQVGAAFVSSVADVQALVQTLASMTAVNQT